MDSVIIAVGSNKGNRQKHLREAAELLSTVSNGSVVKSSIYLTEPVGPSKRYFANAVAELSTDVSPEDLVAQFKKYEADHGRASSHSRWGPRTIDLDIIAYGDLVIESDSLIIPHVDYCKRLFVLMPLHELKPHWKDPKTNIGIQQMFKEADELQIRKTHLAW